MPRPAVLCLQGCIGQCLRSVADVLEVEAVAVICAVWAPGRLMVQT